MDSRVRAWLLTALAAGLVAAAPAGRQWLYPSPAPQTPVWDSKALVGLQGSSLRATEADLHNRGRVVDWFGTAAAAPAIIREASQPGGYACGFCHLPGGEGRPENASLAGLPVEYIIAQTKAFRGGTRHAADREWIPTNAMKAAVNSASDADIAAAAGWFSRQRFVSRVTVVEAASVPVTRPLGFILVPAPGTAREAIAGRIIEVPDDPEAFERRDPRSRFTAFVPPGSLARGAAVAEQHACLECHSSALNGWGPGRSPSYILRQLLAFKSGARADAGAEPMQAVVAALGDADMVDVAAWLAAQPVVE